MGSTLVVLKALNVVQLQNKRNWEGKLEGAEGAGGGTCGKEQGVWLLFFFFLSEFSASLDIGCADY